MGWLTLPVHKLFRYDFVLSQVNPKAHARDLMQFIVSDRGLLHSFLFSQQTRNLALAYGSSSLEKRQTFACYAQAVEQINLQLSDTLEACSDANILSVLVLAYHGPVRAIRDVADAPNQGPLSSLQNPDKKILKSGKILLWWTADRQILPILTTRGRL